MPSHRFVSIASIAAPVALVVVAACGGSSAKQEGTTPWKLPGGATDSGSPGMQQGSPDSGSPGPGPSTCPESLASGFAPAPTSFSVPAPRCQTSFDAAGSDGAVSYATLSLQTALHPDLVVFKDMCDATVGQTHWDVYAWGASGFAPAPSPFTVPAPRCQTSFDAASKGGSVSFATMDLTGDGHADLVVFKDMCDATVGQTHWDVYPWSPSGFAPAPTAFTVPAPRCQTSFDAAGRDGSVTYSTMDLDGTGHPDLVVFQDMCDATVGQTHWDVYAWGASGFAPAPTAFTVPAPRCQVSFNAAAQDGSITYSTMDLTGDGHTDLVVFQDSCDKTVGQTHWDTYAWSSSGFVATPSSFTVPAPRCQTDFNAASQDGPVTYAATDVTGDGHPDLVVVQDMCDATVGQTHWDVYPWGASGFAPGPSPFTVPAPRCQTDFNAVAQEASVSYAAMGLASTCGPNLVVFQDQCDTTVGQSHWDVYPQSR